MKEKVTTLVDAAINLMSIENPTDEEIALIYETHKVLNELIESAKNSQLIIGANLLQTSQAFYDNVKNLAEAGDEQAKKIYEELKPLYQAMLQSQIDNNSN